MKMSMKPVDLQVSVRNSQDAALAQSARGRAAEVTTNQSALGFKKDLERKGATVTNAKHAENGRIEDGEPGGGGGGQGSAGHHPDDHEKDREKARDPRKGNILDVTAGFLA
jgi:hypothetical protein